MKIINKSIISLALVFAASGTGFAAEGTTNDKVVRADFKNKVLLIPCVEVTDSPFDGYYNVLMEISGNGSGFDWKVKQANPATEEECGGAPSTSSTDDLLTSLGMPKISDLIGNVTNEDDSEDGTDDTNQNSSTTNSTIENNVNNAIDDAINGATAEE